MPSNALLTPRRSNEEEGHDQIGSNGSTPPGGTATPRPDPTDKRLPGILHSYFGQVRDSLLPRRKSSLHSTAPASSSSSTREQDAAAKEKEAEARRLRAHTLPSPTPSASSRHPSTSQLNGESEKLTEGGFASPRNQATPPQTPRSRSQEAPPPKSRLSSTSTAPRTKDRRTPTLGPPKGKLLVSISEGRGLRPSVDPYVVCQFQWAEYISDGPRLEAGPRKAAAGNRVPAGMAMRRTDSETGGRPMAIPMRSRQSSNNGISSDPREDGMFDEVTSPKWEHDAIL